MEYELQIVRNGVANVIASLRRQVMYIGAGEEDMQSVVEKEKAENRRVEMGNWLAKIGFPPEGRSDVIEKWERNPAFLRTEEFANEKIVLIIRRKGELNPFLTTDTIIEENHEIQNVFLEIPK